MFFLVVLGIYFVWFECTVDARDKKYKEDFNKNWKIQHKARLQSDKQYRDDFNQKVGLIVRNNYLIGW